MTGSRGLRIGLVCPYSFDTHGGVQSHVLGLARHLAAQGHVAQVLGPGQPEGRPGDLRAVGFRSAGGSVPVPYNGSVARISAGPVAGARVRAWLRDGGFDLVHLHEPITPSIALHALAAADVPVVATFHTATPGSRTMRLAGHALGGWIDKVRAGIAVSESAREVVVRHLRRDPVVIPNGFDHAAYAGPSRGGPWRGGAMPRISFLGRVAEPRKGLDVLLAAAPMLRAAVPDADLVVAGDGSRALPGGVRGVGALSEAAKIDLLRTTDVFVAPHTARESFGLVLLEALAGGARVVASDLPAFVDLLDDVPAPVGRTVPRGDPRALAAAVVEQLRAGPHHGEAGVQASRRYDWSHVGAEVVQVYRRVLAGPPGDGPRLIPPVQALRDGK